MSLEELKSRFQQGLFLLQAPGGKLILTSCSFWWLLSASLPSLPLVSSGPPTLQPRLPLPLPPLRFIFGATWVSQDNLLHLQILNHTCKVPLAMEGDVHQFWR